MAEAGGSDQALLRLSRQLSNAGWEVHIALPAPSPLGSELTEAGATLHTVPMLRISTSHSLSTWARYALAWPWSVLRLAVLARRVQVDVVHSNSLHSWYGWAAALLAGKPHLWHAREIVVQSRAALAVERCLARHFARRVFAVSEAVAAQLKPGNVTVVHDEPGPEDCWPGRAGRARSAAALPDEAVLAGYVGRIDTWKGLDFFMDALSSARARRPDLHAVIAGGVVAGKERYAADLQSRAEAGGVRWLGRLSADGAVDLTADLDCLVYPSTEPEPWGLSIVEALACGVPVVSTDAGGPREIAGGLPTSAVRLVAPGDAEALAAAMVALLPAATSTEARQARPVLRPGRPPDYSRLFQEALERR